MKLGMLNRKARAGLCAIAMGLGLYSPAANAQSAVLPGELGGLTFNNTEPDRVLVAQADSAQLMVRIQQLEEQIRSLNGQVEGLTFQLTQMQEIITRMQDSGGAAPAQAAPPVTQETAPITDVPEQGVQPLPGEAEVDPTFGDPSATPTSDIGSSSDPLVGTGQGGGIDLVTGQPIDLSYDPTALDTGNADADAQFAAGYEAMVEGDYAFAADQFDQFVSLYPENPQATEAANWLGEALIYEARYDQAAEVLLEAFQKHPEHERAPDLLLKLGMALSGAGERETACRTYGEVDKRYPDLQPAFVTRLAEEKAKAQCPPA